MTRKQIAEKIKNEIPEGLNVAEKAAYIMVEIAKNKAFDEQYYWGTTGTKKQIHKLASMEKTKADCNKESKRKLICVNMSKLYQYVAEEVGVNCTIISESLKENNADNIKVKSLEHTLNCVRDEQGNWIQVDVQQDLMRLQTGRCPERFGKTRCKYFNLEFHKLEQKEIDDILKKIGYIKQNEKYFDEYLLNLYQENHHLDNVEIIDKFLNDDVIKEKSEKLRIVEKYKFYKSVMIGAVTGRFTEDKNGLDPDYISESVSIFPCYYKKDNKRKFTFGVYCTSQEKNKIYMYSKKHNQVIPIEPQMLEQLRKQRLTFGH